MSPRIWVVLGGLLAAAGIGASAFHAHGLEPLLRERVVQPEEMLKKMHDFDAAVRFQMYHAVALVVVGLLALQARSVWFNVAGALLLIGTLMFSGALYTLVLADVRLMHVAPSGGVACIAGWVVLAVGGLVGGKGAVDRPGSLG